MGPFEAQIASISLVVAVPGVALLGACVDEPSALP